MSRFIGVFMGICHYEDKNIPVGLLYPAGKKDGNKLGKRKKKMEHSGMLYYNHANPAKNSMIIHPTKTDEFLKQFSEF